MRSKLFHTVGYNSCTEIIGTRYFKRHKEEMAIDPYSNSRKQVLLGSTFY